MQILRLSGIKLELMTDVDMFQFIEKGMRGGISYIGNRHGEANNEYMSSYDEVKPSKYIMYLDANNLYGWAMSQCLPTDRFKLLTQKQISKLELQNLALDSKRGMSLEVDLEYSSELHDLHNDYPLAAGENESYPGYALSLLQKYTGEVGGHNWTSSRTGPNSSQ